MSKRAIAILCLSLAAFHSVWSIFNPDRTAALAGVAYSTLLYFCGCISEAVWRNEL